MTRPIFFRIQIAILIFLCSTTSFGQNSQKQLLLGNWTFVKFEFTGDLADVSTERQNKDNLKNKGLTIHFSGDNKFYSVQKGGMQNNNAKGTYKLVGIDKLVIMGDTSKIIQLDKTYLKLYGSGRPNIIFTKSS